MTKHLPVCQRHGDGFYSSGETRLIAAVLHLVDFWAMADGPHSRAVTGALALLLASPIGCTLAHSIRDAIRDFLGHDGMVKLYGELQGA